MDYEHVAAQQAAAKQADFMAQMLAKIDHLTEQVQQLSAKVEQLKPSKAKAE